MTLEISSFFTNLSKKAHLLSSSTTASSNPAHRVCSKIVCFVIHEHIKNKNYSGKKAIKRKQENVQDKDENKSFKKLGQITYKKFLSEIEYRDGNEIVDLRENVLNVMISYILNVCREEFKIDAPKPDKTFKDEKYDKARLSKKLNDATRNSILLTWIDFCLLLNTDKFLELLIINSNKILNNKHVATALLRICCGYIQKNQIFRKDALSATFKSGNWVDFINEVKSILSKSINLYSDDLCSSKIINYVNPNQLRFTDKIYAYDTTEACKNIIETTKTIGNVNFCVQYVTSKSNSLSHVFDVKSRDNKLLQGLSWEERLNLYREFSPDETFVTIKRIIESEICETKGNFRYFCTSGIGIGTKFKYTRKTKKESGSEIKVKSNNFNKISEYISESEDEDHNNQSEDEAANQNNQSEDSEDEDVDMNENGVN